MEKANKIVMVCSLVASFICLGLSIWLALYTHDSFFYTSIIVFLVAVVWLGVNVRKLFQKEDKES